MWNQRFETEGVKGRVIRLYHMTSKQAVSSIVSSQKMIPGSHGMFGSGIYFAETREACLRKARHTEVLLQADVEVGLSYVCRAHNKLLDYKKFVSDNEYDSIRAVDCVSSPEYVVYQSSQVKNIRIMDSEPPKIIESQQIFADIIKTFLQTTQAHTQSVQRGQNIPYSNFN